VEPGAFWPLAVVDAVAEAPPPAAVDEGVADRTPDAVDAVAPAVDEPAVLDTEAAVVAAGWLAARAPMMANIPEVLSPAVRTRAAAALWRRRLIGRAPALRAGRGSGASSSAAR
jgi:hypothetical protein